MKPVKIQVNDVRSIARAEIELDHLALVVARNTTGKTSLLDAVAATLLGVHGVYGATSKDVSNVLRKGAKVASVRVITADQDSAGAWSRSATWPGECSSWGETVPVTPITMGVENPVEYSKSDWASFVRSLCREPTRLIWDDVVDALTEEFGSADDLNENDLMTVKDALRGSWDAAADVAGKEKLVHRRSWERITGERFGEKKAEGWADPGFEGDAPDDLTDEIDRLKKAIEAGAARDAMSEEQRDRARSEESRILSRQEAIKAALETVRSETKQCFADLAGYPETDPQTCPHCGCDVDVTAQGQVILHKPSTNKRGSPAHVRMVQTLSDLQNQETVLARESHELNGRLLELRRALESNKGVSGGKIPEGSEDALRGLEIRHRAAKSTHEAAEAFKRWQFFAKAEHVCGPLGLRFDRTRQAAKELEDDLERIVSKLLPDDAVTIDADDEGLAVLWNGRDYRKMVWKNDPNSYRLMLQIIFQILAAERLGPGAFLVIDRFDTLDLARRARVLGYLAKSERQALIAQTSNDRPDVDKLHTAKVGRTYWIGEGGQVEAV